jgi:hypothetical protein
MTYKTENKKGDGTNQAKGNAPGTADAVPALFPIFPFTTFFLPAIIALAAAGREKAAPDK